MWSIDAKMCRMQKKINFLFQNQSFYANQRLPKHILQYVWPFLSILFSGLLWHYVPNGLVSLPPSVCFLFLFLSLLLEMATTTTAVAAATTKKTGNLPWQSSGPTVQTRAHTHTNRKKEIYSVSHQFFHSNTNKQPENAAVALHVEIFRDSAGVKQIFFFLASCVNINENHKSLGKKKKKKC